MDNGTALFSEKEEIELYMKEYESLRAEIISRIGNNSRMVSLTATAALALVGFLGTQRFSFYLIYCFEFVLFVPVFFGGLAFANITRAARRVAEIEIEVNKRVGRDILVWESQRAVVSPGWWKRAFLPWWKPE